MGWTNSERGIVLLLCSFWLALWPLGTSTAAVSNCGTTDYHHTGKKVNPSFNLKGARANIIIRDADTCTQTGSTQPGETQSLAWVMLTNGSDGWAQVGYVTRYDPTNGKRRRYFWQWKRDSMHFHYTGYWGSPPLGTSINFTATREASDGYIHLYKSFSETPPCNQDNVCPVTPFDPLVAWSSNVEAHFAGEVLDSQTDMPGLTGSRTVFSSVAEKDSSNTWTSLNWTGTQQPDRCWYHINGVDSSTQFEIWTDPVNHNC